MVSRVDQLSLTSGYGLKVFDVGGSYPRQIIDGQSKLLSVYLAIHSVSAISSETPIEFTDPLLRKAENSRTIWTPFDPC